MMIYSILNYDADDIFDLKYYLNESEGDNQ